MYLLLAAKNRRKRNVPFDIFCVQKGNLVELWTHSRIAAFFRLKCVSIYVSGEVLLWFFGKTLNSHGALQTLSC